MLVFTVHACWYLQFMLVFVVDAGMYIYAACWYLRCMLVFVLYAASIYAACWYQAFIV